MFGPNTYFFDNVQIHYSHRDPAFLNLYAQTSRLFIEKFALQDYDVLFIPGSATVGIEALFFSLKGNIRMIGHDGVFTRRWTDLGRTYEKPRAKTFDMFCLFETSCSETFSSENCLVDAVSAFPYYDIPRNTLAFVTCLNKQLGSYIGVSVVCVRKNFWENLLDDTAMSYLNLARYKRYSEICQTPSTAPTYIFEHFLNCLETFDLAQLRARIDAVSEIVLDAVGPENIIGEAHAPAITLKPGVIP